MRSQRGGFDLAVRPDRVCALGRLVRMLYSEKAWRLGEVAELAEGSRLLSGYRVKSSVQGSNPCLSAKFKRLRLPTTGWAPIAQLDRASDYESEGQRFESSWAHQKCIGASIHAGQAMCAHQK